MVTNPSTIAAAIAHLGTVRRFGATDVPSGPVTSCSAIARPSCQHTHSTDLGEAELPSVRKEQSSYEWVPRIPDTNARVNRIPILSGIGKKNDGTAAHDSSLVVDKTETRVVRQLFVEAEPKTLN